MYGKKGIFFIHEIFEIMHPKDNLPSEKNVVFPKLNFDCKDFVWSTTLKIRVVTSLMVLNMILGLNFPQEVLKNIHALIF